jgi:hypothetical protein
MRVAVTIAALAALTCTTACSFGGIAAPAPAAGPAVPGTQAEVDPAAGDPVQQRQAQLVAAEEDRIYAVSAVPHGRSPVYVAPAVAPSVVPTAVLTARTQPYDLTSLEKVGAAARRADGGWDVLMSVVVERGATLRIEAPGALLRMISGSAGFVSIVAVKGTVELVGEQDHPLEIASWDPGTGRVDDNPTDGRSYLRTAGGRLDLSDVSASALGFWSGRTGGVAWTGSKTQPSTGTATRTVVQHSRYGMFAARTAGLVIESGSLHDNELDGLLVHRLSSGITVRQTEMAHNGRNGITVSAGASQVTLSEISAHDNALDGIRIDGAMRPDPAVAAGTVPAAGHTFTVERSVLNGNGESGIVADTAAELRLTDNSITGSPDGIVVSGAALSQEVRGNTVEAGSFGIAVRNGATETRLTGNTVRTATIALQVSDARADLRENVVGAARRYAVSLTGSSGGTTVTDNRLGGRGPAAVDTARVRSGPAVEVGRNDASGWVVEREDGGFLKYVGDHPLLLLWSLILLLPLAAGLWTRRRRRLLAAAAVDVIVAAEPTEALPQIRRRRRDPETTLAMPVTRVTIVSEVVESGVVESGVRE